MEAGFLLIVRAASSAGPVNNGSETYPGAFPPPPGVTPDLENPRDAGRLANIVCLVICDVLVTVLFATRMWVKLRITKNILAEDVTCAIAWACILLYSATVFIMVRCGEGYHSWEISPRDYSQMLKWLYASSIIYCPTAYFTKVTLLLLIARVFAVKERVSRALHVFILALLVAYLPIQAVKIAICTPIHSYWDPNVDGHCLDQRRIFLSDLCVAILTDLVILIVPIPLTWRLRMSWGKKLKIMLLLGAGGAATATTIYRLYAVVEFQKSTDVASDFVLLDILTVVELTIGVMCACLPATNLLFEHHFGGRLSAASPRSPRSGKHQRHGRLAWRGLGTTISRYVKSSSTETAPMGARDEETLSMAEAPGLKAVPPHFDMELAMLSRRGDSDESRGNDEDGVIMVSGSTPTSLLERIEPQSQPEQEWFALDRATSRDGRREGWLSPQGASASWAHEETRASESITLELARVSGNRPWTRIWDGRVNGFGTTATEEQRPGPRPLDN